MHHVTGTVSSTTILGAVIVASTWSLPGVTLPVCGAPSAEHQMIHQSHFRNLKFPYGLGWHFRLSVSAYMKPYAAVGKMCIDSKTRRILAEHQETRAIVVPFEEIVLQNISVYVYVWAKDVHIIQYRRNYTICAMY
jgi:hypothetical protein